MRPLHRTLIVFPLGLLGTSFFFDVAWLAWGRAPLAVTARWLILAGVIGGALASVYGFVDWLKIARGTQARRIGALHGGGNVAVAVLFAASWLLRGGDPAHPPALAIALSAAGVILSVVTGWLGGELVERLSVDVSGGASADVSGAASSEEEGSPRAAGTPS